MKNLVDHLSNYAAYHRDPRNIATHFIGIPLIVLGITTLLSRPVMDMAGLATSPAVLTVIALSAYYLRLSLGLGVLMTGLLALAAWFGAWAARNSLISGAVHQISQDQAAAALKNSRTLEGEERPGDDWSLTRRRAHTPAMPDVADALLKPAIRCSPVHTPS